MKNKLLIFATFASLFFFCTQAMYAQGVTTSSLNGIVLDTEGNPLPNANVIAIHVPSGTQYGASTRSNGQYNIQNMKIGGPYTITVSYVGFSKETVENTYLNLGQQVRLDFELKVEAVAGGEVIVMGEKDDIFDSNRTGAETVINPRDVDMLPSIKRSTRDLTRLDPRSDGNFSFGGRNWLYNNISVDGSYFNNPFGLDDPAPGGQTNAEPLPYDAVEQVQVSIAPFDIREGGFTGAGVNIVTKSGTNNFQGSVYSFIKNESMIGTEIGDTKLLNPDLTFNQSGVTVSGPIIPNKLFLFVNGEIVRREDPGSDAFSADTDSDPSNNAPGVSRVQSSIMDSIRQRMISVY
ncbi:MAG: carboxypeptidase regulatory-like domain-containing protein, partial [Ignavibacteriaceae bacterium]|nr:carboxypeptidase regulatory-like domain-containing protein [Ignavibacteriaceae bacterium]